MLVDPSLCSAPLCVCSLTSHDAPCVERREFLRGHLAGHGQRCPHAADPSTMLLPTLLHCIRAWAFCKRAREGRGMPARKPRQGMWEVLGVSWARPSTPHVCV